MARKLTKALRGKRRWIGLQFGNKITSRQAFQERLNAVLVPLELLHDTRLMDVVPSSDTNPKQPEFGRAILCVRLEDAPKVRGALEPPDAMETLGIQCVTTSGKIRLVRERLDLPRPKRRR